MQGLVSDELYHHGILGMKWGKKQGPPYPLDADEHSSSEKKAGWRESLKGVFHRKYKNRDGSLTEAGKEHASRISGKYSERYKDFEMKKGSKFNRVGAENEKDEGRTYVSFTKEDEKRYISYYEELGATTKMKLSAVSDIKVAGGKAQIDTFLEMYGDHKPEDFAARTGQSTRFEKREFKEKTKLYKNALKNEESFNKAFEDFSASIMAKNSISDEFIKRMSDKGYSAVVDINDRDAADMPLYVFDRRATLKTTGRSEITTRDIDEATEWLHRNMRHTDEGSNELYHHGILGMKWGVRRYQNPDGSLTDAGRKRYTKLTNRVNKLRSKAEKYDKKAVKAERSAHRFWFRDAEAAYAKYSKFKYKAEAARTKADKIEKKVNELARNTSMREVNGIPDSIRRGASIVDKVKSGLNERNRQKKLAAAAEKRKATIEAKKAHAAEKEEALKSGDPNKVSKFQNELTNDELRAATDRIRLTETLRNQSEASVKTGLDKAEEIIGKVSKAKDIAERGISAWNTAAKIHNSFVSEKEKWPVIDGSGKKEDRSAIKKTIETGDPEQIARLKGKLTVSETSDAVKSINNWKNINENADKNKQTRVDAEYQKKESAREAEKQRDLSREKMFSQRDSFERKEASRREQESFDKEYEDGVKAAREAFERYKESSRSNTTIEPTSRFDPDDRATPQMRIGQERTNQLLLELKKDRKLYKDLFK